VSVTFISEDSNAHRKSEVMGRLSVVREIGEERVPCQRYCCSDKSKGQVERRTIRIGLSHRSRCKKNQRNIKKGGKGESKGTGRKGPRRSNLAQCKGVIHREGGKRNAREGREKKLVKRTSTGGDQISRCP